MKEIGLLLKQKREARGISVDELYARTRIKQRVIEALEAGRFEQVPGGGVYARGFIRTLCEELGIDYHEVMSQFEPALSSARLNPVVARQKTPRINWVSTAGAFIMIVALVTAGVYYVHWRPRPQAPSANPVQEQPPVSSEPVPTPTPQPEPVKPAVTFLRQEGNKDVYLVEKWPMELTVSVLEDQCWVSVIIDQTQTSSVTLSKGQERIFLANTSLDMRLGRARVVEIKVNGQALLGQTGDVRDYTFTKTGP